MTLQKPANVREEVISLIRKSFGDETADMYRNFFQDDDDQTILQSAKDLFTQIMGEKKAEEALRDIEKGTSVKV